MKLLPAYRVLRRGRCLGLVAAGWLWATCLAVAQQPSTPIIKNFSTFPGEYYPPPHASQPKSQLQGAEGLRLSAEQYRITTARLTTFKEDGSKEVVIEAPECTYDDKSRSAGSAGPLQMRTADGKFLIEGRGFTWQQTNSSMFISNDVHTLIQAELLAQPTNTSATAARRSEPLDIVSEQFDYGGETGVANYRRNVKVTGTNLALATRLLTVEVPMKERQLQTITAEGGVALDYSGVHAGGDHAVWRADTGLARVTGNPYWSTAQREGRAKELIIDATNRVLQANGNASLKMSGQSFGTLGLRETNAPAPVITNHTVEILSDRYEISTNLARFSNHVRARETAGEQLRTMMECGELTAWYAGTNQLERMRAERSVRIEQEDQRLTAGKAYYTATNGLLELTDHPAWRSGEREGRGDRILVAAADNELSVYGNAYLKLPANASEATAGKTGAAPPGAGATNQFAEVFCREYVVRPQIALLEGGVQLEHPRLKLACDHLSYHSKDEGQQQHLVAQHSVTFDLLSEAGQKVHGTCQEAVYHYEVTSSRTNDVLQLTGDPVLQTTNGSVANPVIVLDRTEHKVMAKGPYRIKGKLAGGPADRFPQLKR